MSQGNWLPRISGQILSELIFNHDLHSEIALLSTSNKQIGLVLSLSFVHDILIFSKKSTTFLYIDYLQQHVPAKSEIYYGRHIHVLALSGPLKYHKEGVASHFIPSPCYLSTILIIYPLSCIFMWRDFEFFFFFFCFVFLSLVGTAPNLPTSFQSVSVFCHLQLIG